MRMRARVALDAAPLKIGSTFSLKLIAGGFLGGFAAQTEALYVVRATATTEAATTISTC